MIKQALAAAALALALGVVGATPAAADGVTAKGSGPYGNFPTHGIMSPQLSLIEGTLNSPCIAHPGEANLQQIAGLVNIAVLQDLPILSSSQNQQCTEISTQANGKAPISHILD